MKMENTKVKKVTLNVNAREKNTHQQLCQPEIIWTIFHFLLDYVWNNSWENIFSEITFLFFLKVLTYLEIYDFCKC